MRTVYRQIQSLLKPVGNAVGPFGGAIHGVIGNDAAGEIRGLAPDGGEIGVDWFTFKKRGTYEITGTYLLSFFTPANEGRFVAWEDYAAASFNIVIR